MAILRSSKDWPRWFANIRDQAMYDDIWEFVDPQATPPTGEKEVITMPLEPSVADNNASASETSLLMQFKYRCWEKKVKAIKSLDNHVMQTLGPYFMVVKNCTSLHEKLKALKASMDYARALEVKKKYAALQEGPARKQKVLDWLSEWESTVQQAKQLKITSITADIDATRAFLDAIEQTDPYFSAFYTLQIIETAERYPEKDLTKEFPDGVEIARLFRQMYRRKTARGDPSVKAGFPGPTLQDEEAPTGSRSKQKCIDGTAGHSKKMPYPQQTATPRSLEDPRQTRQGYPQSFGSR